MVNIIQGTLPNSNNYKRGRTKAIKYLVIHYTGNKGDTATNNVKYFTNNVVKSSAHYFIDENSIYSSVPVTDTAYHCGGGRQARNGGKWFDICTNSNSIGIEMCLLDKNGIIRDKTVINTVELIRQLMKEYKIPAENVIRHWDVNGKNCPAPFAGDDNAYWRDLQKRINTEEDKDMMYNTIEDMPEFARATIQKLCDKGVLKGDSNGLNLSYDMLRIFVILDRAGVFE